MSEAAAVESGPSPSSAPLGHTAGAEGLQRKENGQRVAAPGENGTNGSCAASAPPVAPPEEVCAVALPRRHRRYRFSPATLSVEPLPLPPSVQPVGLPEFTVGWAQSQGNRPNQDDRCVEFLLPLPNGGSALVWAVSNRPARAAALASALPCIWHAATVLLSGIHPAPVVL